jgi:hypothetical protein
MALQQARTRGRKQQVQPGVVSIGEYMMLEYCFNSYIVVESGHSQVFLKTSETCISDIGTIKEGKPEQQTILDNTIPWHINMEILTDTEVPKRERDANPSS